MDMIFDFDDHQGLTNVRFGGGLDGTEEVSSVKEALNLLKIRNPATSFAEAVSDGLYDRLTGDEYQRMLQTVRCINLLWRYAGESEEAPIKYEMNVLMLLANAIEALSQLNAKYKMPFGSEPQQP